LVEVDPHKSDGYLMKQRLQRKKKKVDMTCETRYAMTQHETRHAEMKEPRRSVMIPLIMNDPASNN